MLAAPVRGERTKENMAKLTFVGGIHPYDGKELSKEKPIGDIVPGKELVYPLSQHIGAPAKALAAKGDRVLAGQKIAESGGFVSAPVYASVSGTVKAVEPRRVASGDMVMSIVVENDEQYEKAEPLPRKPLEKMGTEDIIAVVREAGIVGMGGAGFPTHVKLSPKEPDKIDYVIANCAECEPYLTSDYRRMLEEPEKLVGGLKIILKLFPGAQGILAVEDNKPDCIKVLEDLVREEEKIQVKGLKTKYPQGGERQLIYAVTGRKINSTMLPADAGCIVDNVETIIAVYNAVKLGKPVTSRISTITGDAVAKPGNYLYSIGTSYAELIEAAGGFKTQPEKIISGGPMMGFAMFGVDIPTTKTSSSLLCLTKDEVAEIEPSACINCGRCVQACPELLVPSRLAKFGDNGLSGEFEQWNGLECIECGSCSFVCPARRQLAQSIKTMKKQVLAAKRKK